MLGKTISHYKILEKLGEGGMGEVYLGQDTELDRKVALKFLPSHYSDDPEIKVRFKQEAKAAAALNHPNIVTIHEVGEHEGRMFMVMEYTEGQSLAEIVGANGGSHLRLDDAINYACQIAAGLQAAHDKGIVHRDIKPANILIDTKGRVRIADFGLAKTGEGTRLTKEASTLGTVDYMSPEQARGGDVDRRSDIFSFGVVLYEMITGQRPFQGDYHAAVTYSIVHEHPEPLARYKTGVSEQLQRIVDKALDKNADTRYQHIDDLLADLKALRKKRDSGSETMSGLKKKGYLIGGLAVLAVIAFFIFRSSQHSSADLKSIAVLPFENISPDKENEYFSDGITEDILTNLSTIGGLRVISRTSVMQFKGSDRTIREIADELGVAYVLEGSVRRADDQVLVSAKLVDAQNDAQLWANNYNRKLEDIFLIQSEVAKEIASALQARLSPEETERIEKKPTSSLDAYIYYLRGKEYWRRRNREDNEKAIDLFKKAINLDSMFALAYAGLGWAYAYRATNFGQGAAWRDSAISVSQKAVMLDPSSAEAYQSLGFATRGRNREQALHFLLKANSLNADVHTLLPIATIYLFKGELDQAIFYSRKAISYDPVFPLCYVRLGMAYRLLDNSSAAEKWLTHALTIGSDMPDAKREFFKLLLSRGEFQKAIEFTKAKYDLDNKSSIGDSLPNVSPQLYGVGINSYKNGYHNMGRALLLLDQLDEAEKYLVVARGIPDADLRLAFLYWKTGRKEDANRIFDEQFDYYENEFPKHTGVAHRGFFRKALIQAVRNEKEKALKSLRQAIDAGWRDYRLALADPLFENLRDEEEFEKMMAEVKGMVKEMRKRVEEMDRE